MGSFFRRSAKLGPFRLNFSKSGIGVSAGIRGARVSIGPKGTYLNLGTNGVYYRQKLGGRYSKAGPAKGLRPLHTNSVPYPTASLPTNLTYPVFPKHGLPRIVTTLGVLSIPILIILVWVAALIGTSSRSEFRSNDNSLYTVKKTADDSVQTNRQLGFRAGFDYALRMQTASSSRKLDQRRLQQLAAQVAAKERKGQDWQQGWIEGYTRGFDKSIGSNNTNIGARSDQSAPGTAGQGRIQQFPTARNGYTRGPRGGCYYLSASGRKVYVDRVLCN